MNSDLEKERTMLKVQANVLNNRMMSFLLAAEMLQDYRSLVQQMSNHNEKLYAALNEKENSKRDGGSVPPAPQQAA